MTPANEKKLISYVAELEARMLVMEKFINQVFEEAALNVPSQVLLEQEYNAQRKIVKSKYSELT